MNFVKGMIVLSLSKAKLAGNARHQAKLRRIVIQPKKEEAEKIIAAANASGKSLTQYILDAVYARMESENP